MDSHVYEGVAAPQPSKFTFFSLDKYFSAMWFCSYIIKHNRRSVQIKTELEGNIVQTTNPSYAIAKIDSHDNVQEEDHIYDSIV